MSRYPFPSHSSPHSPHYYVPPPHSSHSTHSAPRHRQNSLNASMNPVSYSSSSHGHNPGYYLAVPATRTRSRSRSRSSHGHDSYSYHDPYEREYRHHDPYSYSHSHHASGRSPSQARYGHGHRASVSNIAYSAPAYSDSGHNRSSHRHASRSSYQSHTPTSHQSHLPSYAPSHGTTYFQPRQRSLSISDRVRNFFGLQPSELHRHSTYSTPPRNEERRRRNSSLSGFREEGRPRRSNSVRTGPWFFGSVDNKRYLDEHGREVDHRGRVIHRM